MANDNEIERMVDSGRITPRDLARRTPFGSTDSLLNGLFQETGHRHYFLRTQEVEHEDGEGHIVTRYHYKCVCGERVDP